MVTILVMTQERIERLFAVKSSFHLRTLIVDEAHKLGEGPRGVILQRIIDEALGRSDDCRVVLAAPHAENAGVLLPRPKNTLGQVSLLRSFQIPGQQCCKTCFGLPRSRGGAQDGA